MAATDSSRATRTGVFPVARRELGRILSRPIYPMLMLALPVFSFALLWAIFHLGLCPQLGQSGLDHSIDPRASGLGRLQLVALGNQVDPAL